MYSRSAVLHRDSKNPNEPAASVKIISRLQVSATSEFLWLCQCNAMCEHMRMFVWHGNAERDNGKVIRVQIYHLDRQRRVATLLGQIINMLLHWKFNNIQHLTHFMSHVLSCNILYSQTQIIFLCDIMNQYSDIWQYYKIKHIHLKTSYRVSPLALFRFYT